MLPLMVNNEGLGGSIGHQVMLAAKWAASCRGSRPKYLTSSSPRHLPLVLDAWLALCCQSRRKTCEHQPLQSSKVQWCYAKKDRQDDSELLLNYGLPSKWQPSAVTQAARQVPRGDNSVSLLNEVEEAPYSLLLALIATVSINF